MRKIIFIIIFVFVMVLPVYASPGGTEKGTNCHCCYTNCEKYGLKYGEYHCHNNGTQYIPSRKKVCPGPGEKSYYPTEDKTSTTTSKPVASKENQEDNKDNNYGRLALGGLGLYLAGTIAGKRKG